MVIEVAIHCRDLQECCNHTRCLATQSFLCQFESHVHDFSVRTSFDFLSKRVSRFGCKIRLLPFLHCFLSLKTWPVVRHHTTLLSVLHCFHIYRKQPICQSSRSCELIASSGFVNGLKHVQPHDDRAWRSSGFVFINILVCQVSKESIEIRQMELDWYTRLECFTTFHTHQIYGCFLRNQGCEDSGWDGLWTLSKHRTSPKFPKIAVFAHFFHFFPRQELRRHGHASRDVCWFCLRTDYGTGACINTFLVRGEQGSQWVYTVIARKVDELWWILINNILNCMFVIRLSNAINVGKWLINHRSPQTIGGEELDFFNWCCKGSSVEIDYRLDYNYMDYVLVLAGCFCCCCHFLSFPFISFLFFMSIHFISFPFHFLITC